MDTQSLNAQRDERTLRAIYGYLMATCGADEMTRVALDVETVVTLTGIDRGPQMQSFNRLKEIGLVRMPTFGSVMLRDSGKAHVEDMRYRTAAKLGNAVAANLSALMALSQSKFAIWACGVICGVVATLIGGWLLSTG